MLIAEEILNERCVYREHLCALHRENLFTGISSSTLYLRIIRVFYVITQHSDDVIVSDTPGQANIGLTSRAFMPKPLVPDTARDKTTSVTSSSQDRRPVFEEQKRLVERVNQWLSITGINHVFPFLKAHANTSPIWPSSEHMCLWLRP